MKFILLTSSAVLLVSGMASAQAQEADCPAAIDAFTRDYEQAMGAAGDQALSASEQAQLFGLRTTAENMYASGNLEMCAEAIERARLMLETAIAPTAIQPSQLVGMDVRNAADEKLGEVDDVALDPVSGRIAYIVIEHGGFLGIGEDVTPVPWRAVTWMPGAEHLLVELNEDRLENAPRFLEDEVTAQERRAWLLSVHSYHGVEPYWQDTMAGMMGGGAAAAGAGTTEQEGTAPGAELTAVVVAPAEGEAGTAQSEAEPTTPTDTGTAAATSEPPAEGETAEVRPFGEPAEGETAEGETAGETVVGETTAGAAPDDGAMAALMQRIDDLEGRIEELSDRGLNDDVQQAIDQLESQVQELAQQAPGEDVQQAIAELRDQVDRLAQQAPGDEIRQAVAQLDERVQQLAESAPGQELRETVARMESEIRQLTSGAAATDEDQAEPLGQLGQGTQPEPPAAEQGSGVQGSAALGEAPATESGTVVYSTAGGDQTAGSGQTGSGGVVTMSVEVVEPEKESTAATGGAQSDNQQQAALTSRAGQPEPCEAGITRLEDDLERAEQEGLATDEAQRELEAAQAMMRRQSEALCRAAVKRAEDKLVAQGFEPTQAD